MNNFIAKKFQYLRQTKATFANVAFVRARVFVATKANKRLFAFGYAQIGLIYFCILRFKVI